MRRLSSVCPDILPPQGGCTRPKCVSDALRHSKNVIKKIRQNINKISPRQRSPTNPGKQTSH